MNIRVATAVLALSMSCGGCERDHEKVAPALPPVETGIGANPMPVPLSRGLVLAKEEFLKEREPATTALTVREAAWMKKNGFLTPADLASLDSLDSESLHFESAEHGDMRAATLLGLQRAKGGDLSGASSALDRAARLGSLYAYEQLAIVDLQRAIGDLDGKYNSANDPQRAVFVAQMEAARRRGDSQVDFYIKRYAAQLNRSQYGAAISAQTDEFMRQYYDDLKVRGLTPPVVVMRPDSAQWDEARRVNAGTTVSVFSW